MSYTVKEIFYTLQGEGANAGRAAVFLRFAGCNLWSGREEDRATAACRFCDTDFRGGEPYPDAARLALAIRNAWPGGPGKFVVVTGGEPALQSMSGGSGFVPFVSTARIPTALCIWITVSPKAGTEIVTRAGAELKVGVAAGARLGRACGVGLPTPLPSADGRPGS